MSVGKGDEMNELERRMWVRARIESVMEASKRLREENSRLRSGEKAKPLEEEGSTMLDCPRRWYELMSSGAEDLGPGLDSVFVRAMAVEKCLRRENKRLRAKQAYVTSFWHWLAFDEITGDNAEDRKTAKAVSGVSFDWTAVDEISKL